MIRYDSNNSGGDWWLTDEDWKNLEKVGWVIDWEKERFLGALARSAVREGLTLDEARAEFEHVVRQDAGNPGCECCGPPHYFYEVEK